MSAASDDSDTTDVTADPRSGNVRADADRPEDTSAYLRRRLDGLLPRASVDSHWWYWIAAVPAYFVLTIALGAAAIVLFLLGFGFDLVGASGLASLLAFFVFAVASTVFALAGILLAVFFPLAAYVDARAVEEAGLSWRPDPVLYGLGAAAAVIATNFVLSVPLALYYLYRRHEVVGTP